MELPAARADGAHTRLMSDTAVQSQEPSSLPEIQLQITEGYQQQRARWAARREEMRALLAEGWTYAEIGKRYGIKPQTAYVALNGRGRRHRA